MTTAIIIGCIIIFTALMYYLTKYFYEFGMLRCLKESQLKKVMNSDANAISTEQKMIIIRGFRYMDKMPSEDKWIESFDKLKLHGKLYPAPEKSRKFVLCIHGCRTNSKSEFAPFIRFYHDQGYNVFLPDDRAHGESEGELIGFGCLDRFDVVDWAKFLVDEYGEDIEILIQGVSMGAAASINACGEDNLPKQVMGLVADCSFTSVIEQFGNSFQSIFHIPKFPFVPLCSLMSKFRGGYSFYEHSPLENSAKIKVPVLFIQGDEDNLVKPEMAKRLYDACKARKRNAYN